MLPFQYCGFRPSYTYAYTYTEIICSIYPVYLSLALTSIPDNRPYRPLRMERHGGKNKGKVRRIKGKFKERLKAILPTHSKDANQNQKSEPQPILPGNEPEAPGRVAAAVEDSAIVQEPVTSTSGFSRDINQRTRTDTSDEPPCAADDSGLTPWGKAVKNLTDEEFKKLDALIRSNPDGQESSVPSKSRSELVRDWGSSLPEHVDGVFNRAKTLEAQDSEKKWRPVSTS